jgi:hypothetical protein
MNQINCLKFMDYCKKATNNKCLTNQCSKNICLVNNKSSCDHLIDKFYKENPNKFKIFIDNLKPCQSKHQQSRRIRLKFGR